MQLLLSLGRTLVRKKWQVLKGLQPLVNYVVPGGGTLVEIAVATWDDYNRSLAQRAASGASGDRGC